MSPTSDGYALADKVLRILHSTLCYLSLTASWVSLPNKNSFHQQMGQKEGHPRTPLQFTFPSWAPTEEVGLLSILNSSLPCLYLLLLTGTM